MEGFDHPKVVNIVEEEVAREDYPKSDKSNENIPQDNSNVINSMKMKNV